MARVEKVGDPRVRVVVGFGLCDLIVVMGEFQVNAA